MKRRFCIVLLLVCLLSPAGIVTALASGMGKTGKASGNAIVLAHFGTTVPEALTSITNISDQVRAAYPGTEVRITFTSNIIRSVWRERRTEAQKWLDQGVPEEILYVKNVIATIGDLREDGFTNIIVQPSHMFFMEQSHDLLQYVNGLAGIRTMKERWRPFDNLVMGRPALGMPGDIFPYEDDIAAAVATLAADVDLARQAQATLVYMGHGNEHWSTSVYAEVQAKMREVYPDVKTVVGVVEGYPGIDEMLEQLRRTGSNKVLLKPFMIVSGDHAVNDMAGPEPDSWKSILTAQGYEVQTVLEGLGSNDDFVGLFIRHIADAALARGIELK